MDRKTLLGLITGAGMLGLVLFFGGMLVGAGLFMEPDVAASKIPAQSAPLETLATLPDSEPVIETPVMDTASAVAEDETGADDGADSVAVAEDDDPVGDLIAERTAEMAAAAEMDQNEVVDVAPLPDAPEIAETDEVAAVLPSANGAPQRLVPPAIKKDAGQAAASDSADSAPAAPAAPAETAAAPAATPAPSAPAVGDQPYSVQIGAFKVDANARQRAGDLRKEGLSVAVVERRNDGGEAWYYVRVGSYADMKAARAGADKIKKDQGIDGFPVRAEPNDRRVDG